MSTIPLTNTHAAVVIGQLNAGAGHQVSQSIAINGPTPQRRNTQPRRSVTVSVLLFALGSLISWTAARALGRHLRLDAALDSTHELIRSGPYRIARHPIYKSMLCVLLGTGILIAPFYLLIPAIAVFLIGTEIRMRIEDKLLAAHFGDDFQDYKRRVARLIPVAY